MAEQPQAETIFGKAIEIGAVGERNAFLDGACHGDPALRQEVDKLVHDYFRAGEFLEQPVAQIAAPTIDQPITEKPGTQIGPYKLLQQLGEGGMGVVYMAEQKEPVKRRVALKIIKPGMDTRQVIARFEAERQALAMMDHPNIAKVLDAGQTDSGRPYFVMELVKGVPVTQYCDEQHLTPKERLELFVPICQAVQHAHQKGIIHRDLKPSNILVALFDGQPVCKVIDFGVAKATNQTLTEKTMFTQLGQVVGTLEYMSPEQAQVNQLDVDTRSDIYSLGVVLYELLTAETPFDRERLRSAAFDEMLRIIREEEPSKPSTKVSSSQSLPSIAANRRIEPARLGSTIRGELDWIVMKALEKDRGRRYETASKFAEDVQHYLSDEPVVACPPSAAYRFRKFARRNKAALSTAVVVTVALLLGIAGTTWQAINATHALNRAVQAERDARIEAERANGESERASREAANARDQKATAEAERQRAEANLGLAMEALNDLYLKAVGRDRLLREGDRLERLKPLSSAERELLETGLQFYGRIASQNEGHPTAQFQSASAYLQIAQLRSNLEETDEAERAFIEAIDRFQTLTQSFPDTGLYFKALGRSYLALGHHSRWWPEAKDTFVDAERALSNAIEIAPDDAELYDLRSFALQRMGQGGKSLDDLSRAAELDPDSARMHRRLGIFLQEAADFKDRDVARSIQHLKRAIELDPQNATSYAWLGRIQWIRLHDRGRAIRSINKALEIDPDFTLAYIQRQAIKRDTGDLQGAMEDARRAIQTNPVDDWAARELGIVYARLGRYDEAIKQYEAAERLGPNSPWVYSLRGDAFVRIGQYENALRDYTKALELKPNYWIYYKNRANINFQLKRYSEALADAAKSLEINPKDTSVLARIPPTKISDCTDAVLQEGFIDLANRLVDQEGSQTWVYQWRAQALVALKRWPDAIADYTTLIKLEPKNSAHLLQRGQARRAAGDKAGAEADFEAYLQPLDQAVTEKPEDWQTWNRRGIALSKLVRWDAAIDDFARACELAPEEAVVWRNRATCYLEVQMWGEAASDLGKVIELAQANWLVHYHRGLALLSAGDEAGYRAACRSMLETLAETRDPLVANFVAWTCSLGPAALDDWKPALELARLAVEQQGQSVQNQNTLGALLMRAGQTDEAITVLAAVAQQLDNSSSTANISPEYTWYFLAMAHKKAGSEDEARQYLNKANKSTDDALADEKDPPPWNRKLTLELLRNEAESLIDGETSLGTAKEKSPDGERAASSDGEDAAKSDGSKN